MDVYLMRHGIAGPVGRSATEDDARPLTPEGKKKIRRIAETLQSLRVSFDLILTSPLLRARQTAALVAEGLGIDAVELAVDLSPDRSPDDILRRLRALSPFPSSVLLVGHEPSLHKTASLLLSGREELQIRIKKGGILKISLEAPVQPSTARLELLLVPKILLGK